MTERPHDLALVIADLAEGGAQRVLALLARGWADIGKSVAVITLADRAEDYYPLDPRVTRVVVGGSRPSNNKMAALRANLHRVRDLRTALVSCGAPVAIAFVAATNVLTVLAARGTGVRVVISERNDPARQSLGPVWNGLRFLLYRHAHLVTANSHAAIAELGRYVPAKKLAYVANPVVPPSPLPAHVPERLVLSVGRLVRQKAHDVLLRAFAAAARERSGWRLAIAGSGECEGQLRDLTRALGLEQRVSFLGRVDPWPWYARAAIFALPSRYEGTSNALLEAMSMGIPSVVTSTAGDSAHLVHDESSGLVVPADDDGALAGALGRLMDDEHLRERLGAAAAACLTGLGLTEVVHNWETLVQRAAA